MYLEQSLTLSTYAESLRHLLTHIAEIDFLLPGHGNEPLPSSRIAELLHGAEAILNGEVTGTLEQTHLGTALCVEFPTCKICYREDRLR